MRIWHLDAGADPDAVDGVSNILWRLAPAQARAGHDVTLCCRSTPTERGRAVAAESGLRLVEIRRSLRSHPPQRVLGQADRPPDLVHLHSAWYPYHGAFAAWCRLTGQPFASAPHGGHTPVLMATSAVRRRLYLRGVERPTTFAARAAIYASAEEAEEAAALFGCAVPGARIAAFPAPVEDVAPSWSPGVERRPIVYLGRFDVFQKGIDGFCELARHAPELEFRLYGEPPDRPDARRAFDAVAAGAPANLRFEPAVGGAAKRATLAGAGAYLQYSRYEGFALAVLEALASGVPVFCADRLPFAREAAERGAIALLSSEPVVAARQLQATLADPRATAELAAAGAAWVAPRTDIDALAAAHLAIYAEAISGSGSPRRALRRRSARRSA